MFPEHPVGLALQRCVSLMTRGRSGGAAERRDNQRIQSFPGACRVNSQAQSLRVPSLLSEICVRLLGVSPETRLQHFRGRNPDSTGSPYHIHCCYLTELRTELLDAGSQGLASVDASSG